jgi:hypothetical protein
VVLKDKVAESMKGSKVSVSAEGERCKKPEFREFEGREGSESETDKCLRPLAQPQFSTAKD